MILGDQGRTQNQLIDGVPQGPPFFVHYNFETTGNIVRGGLNFKVLSGDKKETLYHRGWD